MRVLNNIKTIKHHSFYRDTSKRYKNWKWDGEQSVRRIKIKYNMIRFNYYLDNDTSHNKCTVAMSCVYYRVASE